MTPSEEKIARYTKIERASDEFGRVIGVHHLRLSQILKVEEMTPALDGASASTDEDGEKIEIPKRTIPFLAAMVCEIDGTPIPFPRNRGELDAILDRLDNEGVRAANAALQKLNPPSEKEGEISAIEAAKK